MHTRRQAGNQDEAGSLDRASETHTTRSLPDQVEIGIMSQEEAQTKGLSLHSVETQRVEFVFNFLATSQPASQQCAFEAYALACCCNILELKSRSDFGRSLVRKLELT